MTPYADLTPACEDLTLPACRIVRPRVLKAPVVFASPHSGNVYPQDLTDRLAVPLMDLRRTEDAFVDRLFGAAPEAGAILVGATYARSYVDLNRNARELDPSMFSDGLPRTAGMAGPQVKAGLGCLPKVGATGQVFYNRLLTRAEGAKRLECVHDAYHATLRSLLKEAQQDWAETILIDCHSMPSKQPGRLRLPDIVLGDRFGSSCSGRLTSLAERHFRKAGLTVARNAPYAGGYTTRLYGRPRRGCHVLQIEINRNLYMNEQDIEPNAGFEATRKAVTSFIENLVEFSTRFCA